MDKQNTALLRSIPGLEGAARSMLSPVAEQILLMENISTSIKLGQDQLPSVFKLLTEAVRAEDVSKELCLTWAVIVFIQ